MKLKSNDIYWVTKDGTPIPIVLMDVDHLHNTIKMLERTGRTDHPSLEYMRETLKRKLSAGVN